MRFHRGLNPRTLQVLSRTLLRSNKAGRADPCKPALECRIRETAYSWSRKQAWCPEPVGVKIGQALGCCAPEAKAYLQRGRLSRLFGSAPSALVFRYFFPFRVAMMTQTELPFTLVQKRQVPSSIPLIATSSLMHQGPPLLEPVAPPI